MISSWRRRFIQFIRLGRPVFRPRVWPRGRSERRMVMRDAKNAAITGWGCYSPAKILDNHDLERMVDTSDEWVTTRTGIHERRIAGPGETTASMCALAGQRALER